MPGGIVQPGGITDPFYAIARLPRYFSVCHVAAACLQAGFTPPQAVTMVAIAGAESSYNQNAVCFNGPNQKCDNYFHATSHDLSVFQINDSHKQYSANQLVSDIDYAARAAYALSSKGTNFSPWTTFKAGRHVKYIPGAKVAVAHPCKGGRSVLPGPLRSAADAAGSVADAALAIPNFLSKLTSGQLWLRILLIIGGFALMIGGLVLVGKTLVTTELARG